MEGKTIKKAIIIAISALLVLLLVAITLGITGAYFGSKREISGKVNLSPGLRVDFTNDKGQITIDFDKEENEFWLMKYDMKDNFYSFAALKPDSTISRFTVDGVREGAQIALVPPEMKSLTTDDFYIRAKVIYRDSVSKQELTDDKMGEIFGSTTCPISFNNNWLVDENDEWNYYVGTEKTSWTGGVANSGDILKITENTVIDFFESTSTAENVEYVPLVIADGEPEHYSVVGFEVILQIQAVEAAFVNEQFFA